MSQLVSITPKSDIAKYLSQKDNILSAIIDSIDVLPYNQYSDPYVFLIKTIISQTLSNKLADSIHKKLEIICNNNITPYSINSLNRQDLINIGISTSKIEYILSFTEAVISKHLNFNYINQLDDQKALEVLTSIKGIGIWTAKMYLLFFLDRPNVLPIEDKTFLRAYQKLYKAPNISTDFIQIECKKWSPYTSVAVRYLYYAMSKGLLK